MMKRRDFLTAMIAAPIVPLVHGQAPKPGLPWDVDAEMFLASGEWRVVSHQDLVEIGIGGAGSPLKAID